MHDRPARARLEADLGYTFRNPALLENALVHRSAPNELREDQIDSNERLEFLGDGVLDLAIARDLYARFPDAAEGALTRYKATLVSEAALADIARGLDLGRYLLLGKGEKDTGGRDKPSILSDALEAVLGAIYLDGGFEEAERVIGTLFREGLESVRERSAPRGDYKTALQEWTQAHSRGLPRYRLLATEGPDHARTYTVTVALGGRPLAEGTGASKREAERAAARQALEILIREQGD